MPRAPNIVPLPGMHELETLFRWFLNRLKDVGLEDDKRAALSRRLGSLLEHAKMLDKTKELYNQLLAIQKRMQEADTPSSRLGVLGARGKLALWDKLSARLDEAMESNMFALMVQHHLTQTQQAQTQQAQIQQLHQEINRSARKRVKVIDGYRIKNQVEIRRQVVPRPKANSSTQTYQKVNITTRTGRLGSLSVVYKTFVSDSKDAAHELVEEELDKISQTMHINIAQLVGATEGYNGLNGIVVAMEGIDIRVFLEGSRSHSHSGAFWVEFTRGWKEIKDLTTEHQISNYMTVAPSGRITVFPLGSASIFRRIRFSLFSSLLHFKLSDRSDGARMLWLVCSANKGRMDSPHIRNFFDAAATLGLALTDLQVMRIAGSSRMSPFDKSQTYSGTETPFPPFQPQFGEYARATYCGRKLESWESLGTNRYLEVRNRSYRSQSSVSSDLHESSTYSENCWFTYEMCLSSSIFPQGTLRYEYTRSAKNGKLSWENIFNEAEEISRSLNVELDSITFCNDISLSVTVKCSGDNTLDDMPQTLYYHRCPSSPDREEVQGFVSANANPDCGEWEIPFRQRDWTFEPTIHVHFSVHVFRKIETYMISDDWGRRYERMLQKSIKEMPGTYPETHIEEVS